VSSPGCQLRRVVRQVRHPFQVNTCLKLNLLHQSCRAWPPARRIGSSCATATSVMPSTSANCASVICRLRCDGWCDRCDTPPARIVKEGVAGVAACVVAHFALYFLHEPNSVLRPHGRTAFAQRLAELGWIAGRNMHIDYHWGAGDLDISLFADQPTGGKRIVTQRRPAAGDAHSCTTRQWRGDRI
jgi:hypothetical protein